jgi:predicted phosphoribosyltransferase
MLFQNRTDAGRKLAQALTKYKTRHPLFWRCHAEACRWQPKSQRLDAPLDLDLVARSACRVSQSLPWGWSPTVNSQ